MNRTTTGDSTLLLLRLQAVAEETRLALLRLLAEGERCVCELQEEVGGPQPRISFHLRKLKEAGLIAQRKEGRWVYYRTVPGALREIQGALEGLEPRPGQGDACAAPGCSDGDHGGPPSPKGILHRSLSSRWRA